MIPRPHTDTVSRIAEAFSVKPRVVRSWTSAGCPHVRFGSERRFRIEEVADWIAKREEDRVRREELADEIARLTWSLPSAFDSVAGRLRKLSLTRLDRLAAYWRGLT